MVERGQEVVSISLCISIHIMCHHQKSRHTILGSSNSMQAAESFTVIFAMES